MPSGMPIAMLIISLAAISVAIFLLCRFAYQEFAISDTVIAMPRFSGFMYVICWFSGALAFPAGLWYWYHSKPTKTLLAIREELISKITPEITIERLANEDSNNEWIQNMWLEKKPREWIDYLKQKPKLFDAAIEENVAVLYTGEDVHTDWCQVIAAYDSKVRRAY
jgi:hypothetical protein